MTNNYDDNIEMELAMVLRRLIAQEISAATNDPTHQLENLMSRLNEIEVCLSDPQAIEKGFNRHLAGLTEAERPSHFVHKAHMLVDWEEGRKAELDTVRGELLSLIPGDDDDWLANVQAVVLDVLRQEAYNFGHWSEAADSASDIHIVAETESWRTRREPVRQRLIDLPDMTFCKPVQIDFPNSEPIQVKNWASTLRITAGWLVRRGLITPDQCPIKVAGSEDPLIDTTRIGVMAGKDFGHVMRLSPGLYIWTGFSANSALAHMRSLLERCDTNNLAEVYVHWHRRRRHA